MEDLYKPPVIAYLTGNITHGSVQQFGYPIPLGTGLKVATLTGNPANPWIYANIPLRYTYAGAPCIIHGWTEFYYGGWRSLFFVTFFEYDDNYEPRCLSVYYVIAPFMTFDSLYTLYSSYWTFLHDANSPSAAVWVRDWVASPEYGYIPADLYLHLAWDDPGEVVYAVLHWPDSTGLDMDNPFIGEMHGPAILDTNIILPSDSQMGIHPNISCYGDKIWLVYSQVQTNHIHQIVRRWRKATQSDSSNVQKGWWPPIYPPPASPAEPITTWNPSFGHCEYPQASANAVVFTKYIQGRQNTDVYLVVKNPGEPAILDTPVYFDNDYLTRQDSFPHITTHPMILTDPYRIITEHDVLWTEKNPSPPESICFWIHREGGGFYASSLQSSNQPLVQIGSQVPVFYEVICGEATPSYYCLKRDGTSTIDRDKVDVGRNELVYVFSIPEPYLYYLCRAVVRAPKPLVQKFSFDGNESSVSVSATAPETLDFILPPATYQTDHKVILRISGTDGAYLENIKIYQFEIGEPQKVKPQNFVLFNSVLSPFSLTLASTIFNHSLVISYAVPGLNSVRLTVYDTFGRMVKKLADKKMKPGTYTEHWDGRSENGNNCPNGIYFIKLDAGGRSISKKAILIR